MGSHLLIEAFHIHRHSLLLGDFLGHLHREAVGIPEAEGDIAGQSLGAFQGLCQKVKAILESLLEALLLQPHNRENEFLVVSKLREYSAHLVDGYLYDLAQERLVQPQLFRVAYGPPDDPAQDVSPALVAGNNPVGDQERRAASVFGDGRDCVAGVVVGAPLLACQLLRLLYHGLEKVCFVNRADALQDDDGPFEAQAGIDAGRGQRGACAVQVVVELHENQVPQLHEPVAGIPPCVHAVFAVGAAAGFAAASLLAEVVEELGVGPTWPLVAGGAPPVMFVAEPEDLLPWDIGLQPEGLGLVIALVYGDAELLFWQTEARVQKLQREFDGVLFEVVSEAEVAHHFEQRQVG